MSGVDLKNRVQFPEKLAFLFRPAMVKVAHGGRGAGKSWGFGRALLIMAAAKKMLILCGREVQLSIKDSVHRLLSDQIEKLGLSQIFSVTDRAITCTLTGSEFIFTGLSHHTIDSVKSYEGVDITWIEEAQTVSTRSLRILLPTVLRKPGSEVWVSMNPDLETDPAYQRFIAHPYENSIVTQINWRDNPWFSARANAERLYTKEHEPDEYDNIWEGKCRPAVQGAIYYKEIQAAIDQGRVCRVPHDPLLKTHVIFDLGYRNDSMAIIMAQKSRSEIRIIDYEHGEGQALTDYTAMLRERKYNWGRVWLPHDGFSGDYKTALSSAKILSKLGWDVAKRSEITELSVEEGIKATRLKFPQLVFDEQKTPDLIESIKRYRRTISLKTEASSSPVHDHASHGADALRYTAINSDNFLNEDMTQVPIQHAGYGVMDPYAGY